jgi:uncharacterized protein
MTKELWINLPVKDVAKSTAFFKALGFSFNEQHSTQHSACMLIGTKNIVVMLFAESMFEGFSQNAITNTAQSNEMLLSFDAETRNEVDELAKKAADAGGIVFSKPAEVQGWMYGCGFTDLDGHRWNVLHMDMSKMKA